MESRTEELYRRLGITEEVNSQKDELLKELHEDENVSAEQMRDELDDLHAKMRLCYKYLFTICRLAETDSLIGDIAESYLGTMHTWGFGDPE